MKVIFDNECREYQEGWNACNSGAHFLANPYGLAFNGELHRLWERGYNECQMAWDSPSEKIPVNFENLNKVFSITEHPNDEG
jgi:hypothetical protein